MLGFWQISQRKSANCLVVDLRLSPNVSAPLYNRIWHDMSIITGCSDDEIRRVFKRMIDTHYRGFKTKVITLDEMPTSMSRMADLLKRTSLTQYLHDRDLYQF